MEGNSGPRYTGCLSERTFEKYGCYQWTITNFRELWGKCKSLESHIFTYLGEKCYLELRKISNASILVYLWSPLYASRNCLFVEFQLRTDCGIATELLRGRPLRKRTNNSTVSVDFTEFVSEESGAPRHDLLIVRCWVRQPNSERIAFLYPDELLSKKASEKETSVKEETNSKSTKAPEKETSVKEETNSKSEGVAVEPEDAAKQLREEEFDSEYESLKKLQKDLEKLLLNREDSDVTLEVQGTEFPGHRNILRARSSVFTAMFKHKMKETNSGIVTIEDSEPKTFSDFLKYLYTGSTTHVNQENVCQLYTISDKYEVLELKAKCVEFMKCHMTVERFCEYFSLAHMHTEEELISSGIEFFSVHSVEIAKTAKWQIFLQENSTIGNELFLKALTRGNNI